MQIWLKAKATQNAKNYATLQWQKSMAESCLAVRRCGGTVVRYLWLRKKAYAIWQNAYKVLRLCANKHGGAACKYICWITAEISREKEQWQRRQHTSQKLTKAMRQHIKKIFHFIWKTNTHTGTHKHTAPSPAPPREPPMCACVLL